MSVPDSLSPVIRELFVALEHAGDLRGVAAVAGTMLCGEAGREAAGHAGALYGCAIVGAAASTVRYRAYGCPYTLATCEWLARNARGAPAARRLG